jgi:hypothetical protein
VWFGFGLAGFLGIVQKGGPLWVAWLVGIGTFVLGFYIPYKCWYWEICPDRLIHRRYFRRVVWPFTEIAYVGPMTGLIGTYSAARDWLEVRNVSGKMIIVQPADCEEFLLEMRKYLPRITLNR